MVTGSIIRTIVLLYYAIGIRIIDFTEEITIILVHGTDDGITSQTVSPSCTSQALWLASIASEDIIILVSCCRAGR